MAINVLDISCISAMYMYENVVSHRKVALLRHHKSVGFPSGCHSHSFYLACTLLVR